MPPSDRHCRMRILRYLPESFCQKCELLLSFISQCSINAALKKRYDISLCFSMADQIQLCYHALTLPVSSAAEAI